MLKRALSLISVIALFVLAFPLKGLTDATICIGGKSAGSFNAPSSVSIAQLFNADGVSYKFSGDYDYAKILTQFNAKLIHEYNDGDVINLYFYTEKIAKKEKVFNI